MIRAARGRSRAATGRLYVPKTITPCHPTRPVEPPVRGLVVWWCYGLGGSGRLRAMCLGPRACLRTSHPNSKFHESIIGFDLTYVRGPMEGGPPGSGGLSSVPRGGPRPYAEARDRWLVKPTRTTRKDWIEPVRLCRAVCTARRQDGVSAPETRAGRMATSVRMTLGQGSWASDAESYQRSL